MELKGMPPHRLRAGALQRLVKEIVWRGDTVWALGVVVSGLLNYHLFGKR